MNSGHVELWQRIVSFSIDGPEKPSLSFSKRLALENGWTGSFAERAILEYKRFVLLAMTAGHTVCPSEEVDQVWHLHLTYTRSYWDQFCAQVLGKPLHHDPTRGGPSEAVKHQRMYEATLASYRRVFENEAPADLWPPVALRFAADAGRRSVDNSTHWVVRKSPVKRALAGTTALVAAMLASGCVGPILADAQSDRQEYLLLYLVALVSAFIVAKLMRQFLRQPDGVIDLKKEQLDRYDSALLAGGPIRLFDTALIHLMESGALAHAGEGKVAKRGPLAKDADPIDREIYDFVSRSESETLTVDQIRKGVALDLDARREGLFEKNLLLRGPRSLMASLVPIALMFIVLFGLGLQRAVTGIEANKPTWFLVAALVIGFVITIAVFGPRPRRTLRGDAYLQAVFTHYASLGPTVLTARSNLVLGTALLGTGVLAATEYETFAKALHPRNDPTSSGSGCGSGCTSGCGGGDGGGGGGCGGGGCGGGGD